MVSAGSWRDRFKIDESILKAFWEEFSESSPLRASEFTLETAQSTTEFVLWCVRQGHFTEEEFTQYLAEQNSIPSIRTDFYATPIDRVFWDRVKDLHPWTAACFPLCEWEGHLLIASVWAAPEIYLKAPHSFVLGTPTGLREFFDRFNVALADDITPLAEPNFAPKEIIAEPAPKVAAKSVSKEVDDGDPFAALSRELGLLNDKAETDTPEGESESSKVVAPEGLIIPEGLSFSAEEVARLGLNTAEGDSSGVSQVNFDNEPTPANLVFHEGTPDTQDASERGTLVHNFETGGEEVVPRKAESVVESEPASSVPELKLDPAPLEVPLDASLELAPDEPIAAPTPITHSPEANDSIPTAKLTLEEPAKPATKKNRPPLFAPIASSAPTSPVTSSMTMPPPPPTGSFSIPTGPIKTPAKPFTPPAAAESPTLPFAPIVTPKNPAMVKPAAPTPAPTSAPAAATPPAEAKAFEPTSPARPAAEATVVVAATAETEASPKTRKPLFEPGASDAALPNTAISDRVREISAKRGSSETQTGTGSRGKKLEAPPVTSFFSIGGKSSGRVRNESYSKHAITISKIEPIHLDQCSSLDEAGAQALLQMSNVFETAMILLFKDGELVPWKWSDLFLSINGEKPQTIDLKDPSIFKIVFRTAKPYHGYVVTSTTNQKFFNEFYRGMLPKHATVIPIMIDGRMGGMLLAFTNAKIEYRQSLRQMERLSFDLARVFKMLRLKAAKAS